MTSDSTLTEFHWQKKFDIKNVKIIIVWLNLCVLSSSLHNTVYNSSNTHTHTFNGPLSGTTQVSQYQKGKPIWILLKQERVSGSGISWAVCKSAPCSRQITTSAPHHSVFYRPDALPVAQPTVSKHWRHIIIMYNIIVLTHTHTRLTALFPGLPRWAGTRKVKPIWRQWVAVASAGTYASLHLAPDR